jgi:hypothetical protein
MKTTTNGNRLDKGVSLIIIILVMTFMLTVGVALVTITSTGPSVAGNMRLEEQAFNAAEAGFDTAWRYLNDNISNGTLVSFSALYRTTYNGQPGLDNPDPNPGTNPNYLNYFRRLTDQQLFDDVARLTDNYIFASQAMPNDPRLSYTVFVINDDVGGVNPDHQDSLLVCIGKGPRNTYSRLEVTIQIFQQQ